ncbi:protein DFG10 [Aspergillus sclerotioniger CBS 115572]|uniref:Polyprenal reductase n=1 Tax=Aspergillus sclerotioniger CBS 115572 TaxID=1450535 RepID=A0A317XCZ5_9EURO|nr:protein DFG10 [Aspergillus sclerotioniger CBS 115572]PWY95457.1 protein DFG10 [Aspergillus sclerotioniger CBS 115572]
MELLPRLVDTVLSSTHMDAIDVLRAFFLLASCTILSVSILPDSLHSRFVPYGARATSTADSASSPPASSINSPAACALDYVASLTVPHSYFTQFYVTSVFASIFWAVQLLCQGAVFQVFSTRISPEHFQKSMSIQQVFLCWVLMLIQGARRLYECNSFSKPSSSKMWFVHWLVGLAFYLAVSVAVWIEGAGALLSHKLDLDDLKVTIAPSLRTFVCMPIFLLASGIQHDCHHYLFSLKKYTLPTHPVFRRIVCPHYTAECVVYLSLALLAARKGEIVNKTLLSALAFVVINLGATAANTRQWYLRKFGEESVRERWNMIPWVY